MKRRWSLPVVAALTGLTLLSTSGAALATDSSTGHRRSPYTLDVIGDIPYGEEQVANFPRVVDQINDDRSQFEVGADVSARKPFPSS